MNTALQLARVKVPSSILLLLAAAGLYFGLRWFENANLYFPDRQVDITPRVFGLDYEDVAFVAEDGTRLTGWHVKAPKGAPKPILTTLFFHGNGGNIGNRVEKVRILHRLGLAVFIFDYRGYGKSAGSPSERGLYADAAAAYRTLTGPLRVPPESILLHGESLGSAVAIELATRVPAAGVIAESAFTSVVEMGRRIFPFLPVRLLVRQKYDTLAKMRAVKAPLLVMHSPQDDIVPYDMGVALYEAAPGPKVFAKLRGSHNEGFLESGDDYPKAIAGFIEAYVRRKAPPDPKGRARP